MAETQQQPSLCTKGELARYRRELPLGGQSVRIEQRQLPGVCDGEQSAAGMKTRTRKRPDISLGLRLPSLRIDFLDQPIVMRQVGVAAVGRKRRIVQGRRSFRQFLDNLLRGDVPHESAAVPEAY